MREDKCIAERWLREKSITQANSGRTVLQGIPPWERWEKQELQYLLSSCVQADTFLYVTENEQESIQESIKGESGITT